MPISQINQNSLASTASFYGMKNRIINGAMVIDQRSAGASVTPTTGSAFYALDRFAFEISQSSKLTAQQNAGSVTPPAGFTNYQGITSSSAYAVTSTDYFLFEQIIEGFNTADLNWGSANAKTVTLSFWVRSSLTGTFGGNLQNNANDRFYPFSYSIPVANTWTQISVTIAGDTTGTWLTTNGRGILVRWSMGTGSTYLGTAGSWGATTYFGVTGQTNLVGTSGATFYITGVQLEQNTVASNFDFRPYGTELALCQRYCYQINSDNSANGGGTGLTGVGTGNTGNGCSRAQTASPTMRVSPTLTMSNLSSNGTDLRVYNGSVVANLTSIVTNYSTPQSVQFDANTASAYTIGNALTVLWQNSINGGYIRLTAEL